MADSAVQMGSNAMLLLGAQTINSFDDATDRATLVANLWPNMLDAVLRSHPWNCATKRVALAPEAAAPAFDFSYSFLLPGDCLRVLSIGLDGAPDDFQIEGRRILMDESVCYLRYIYRNDDVTSWDALLVQAAEAYMAMTCAYPITKSASMLDQMTKLWQLKLREARTVDGMENPPDTAGDFPLLAARIG